MPRSPADAGRDLKKTSSASRRADGEKRTRADGFVRGNAVSASDIVANVPCPRAIRPVRGLCSGPEIRTLMIITTFRTVDGRSGDVGGRLTNGNRSRGHSLLFSAPCDRRGGGRIAGPRRLLSNCRRYCSVSFPNRPGLYDDHDCATIVMTRTN